jgi:hypothetical protein
MILFYSDSCPHCKLLLETIKRYNGTKFIKLLSIDILKAANKNLPQIHSVPALLIYPEKHILFGKQVFDYLLLPKTGKLLINQEQNEINQDNSNNLNDNMNANQSAANNMSNEKEPASFSINSHGLSDSFAMIEDDTNINMNGLNDRSYNWTSLDMNESIKPDINDFSIETRAKKSEINLSELRSQRALELEQSDLNKCQLPLAISPR